jgi:hypothetical protein
MLDLPRNREFSACCNYKSLILLTEACVVVDISITVVANKKDEIGVITLEICYMHRSLN